MEESAAPRGQSIPRGRRTVAPPVSPSHHLLSNSLAREKPHAAVAGRAAWVRQVFWTCLVAAQSALAQADPESADPNRVREVVPELNAFVHLTDQARLFLLADVARLSPDAITNGEFGIHLDYTFEPILRTALRAANWERDRYLWMRVGYQRAGNLKGDSDAATENRWLLEVTWRTELPRKVWLVNRLRLDLRDIGGSHSNRYRYRIGVEKEFATASGVPFVPYVQASGSMTRVTTIGAVSFTRAVSSLN